MKIPEIEINDDHGELVRKALEVGMIQIPSEIIKLKDIIIDSWKYKYSDNPLNILEIGTKYGGTSFYFASEFMDPKILSLDMPREPPYTETVKMRNMWFRAFFRDSVEFVAADSHSDETYKVVKNKFPDGIDLLFIDGDHSYEGVKLDFNMYYPLVKNGGIIAFHDIVDSDYHRNMDCNVAKFWNEIKHEFGIEEFIENPTNQNWAGIGVIYK